VGTFDERIRRLAEDVGTGRLVASCEVDQVYAHYQHEGLDFDHPRGGQAKYLEQPLFERRTGYLQRLARETLSPGGPVRAMTHAADDLVSAVAEKAPVEFGDLRASGHGKVVDDGTVVYDRPPEVPRLSDEELRVKHRRGP
jgi:hypothetical protein